MEAINEKLTIYSKGKNNIWTDSYISKNLLTAHLDYENDAASRNIRTINKTVNWIDSIGDGRKNLLDLGCGPGIYTDAFFNKGYTVTGIDFSKNSIEYAQNWAKKLKKNITYFYEDYINEKIKGTYDIIICIYCDFGALIPDEQIKFLRNAYDLLNKDGILIFDVFGEGLCVERKEFRTWLYNKNESFWCKESHFILEENIHFKKEMIGGKRIITINNINNLKEFIIWDNYYTKEKISNLLKENGFNIQIINTDIIEKNAFTSNDVMFIKANKI